MEKVKTSLLLTLLCLTCCIAQSSFPEESDESFLVKLIWKCLRTEDLGNCLKLKAAKFLDNLVRMKEPLVITDYLSLAKDPKFDAGYQGLNDTAGKSLKGEENSENLDKIIWDKLTALFTTRTIQLSLPSEMFEGRGKEDKIFKKGHGVFLMAGMMWGMMMKMVVAKVALIAGKALIIGKIALVLSIIIAIRRFVRPGVPAEIVYTSSEQVTGRQFNDGSVWRESGNELAYSAHNPNIHKNF